MYNYEQHIIQPNIKKIFAIYSKEQFSARICHQTYPI